jgi:chromosome segregation ATPase
MDNFMDLTKFELLEKRIEALIEKKTKTEQDNENLKISLSKVEDQLKSMAIQIKTLEEDRQTFLKKLDSLLALLE